MFVPRSIPIAVVAVSVFLGSAPLPAADLVTQDSGGGLTMFNGERIHVTRGPADFLSIFRPKEKKKSKPRRARRAPPLTVSPRPKMRRASLGVGALAGLGAIEDTVARQALDDGIGRLAGYQSAEASRVATQARLSAARTMLTKLETEAALARSPAAILRDLEALDLESAGYDEAFSALKSELDATGTQDTRAGALAVEIARLEAEIVVAEERADAAFQVAANGRDLSPETRRDLNHLLGLPGPRAR